MEDEILRRINDAISSGTRIKGVLFHGTCEPFDGGLEPGPDGILWTSDSPIIAQQYIPKAGILIHVNKPSEYRLQERVGPNPHSPLYTIARDICGAEPFDIETDKYGDIVGWRIPKGWPTNAQVIDHIERNLGYTADNDVYVLSASYENGNQVIHPEGWSMPGRLFMAISDGIQLADIRQSEEPDLLIKEYYDYEAFKQSETNDLDGVIINDHAQTDHYGNFGHISFGLNANGISKLDWIEIPAKRFILKEVHPYPIVTQDVQNWIEAKRNANMHMRY